MIYFLDSDHISLIQWGTAEGTNIRKRLAAIAPDDYATTVVNYEEQCRGWLDRIHRAKTSEARVGAYAELKQSLLFFAGLAVVEYTPVADSLVVAWERAKIRVGTKDLRLAAITVANNATLLTRNTRDFGKVPGLLFEDWTLS